MPLRVQFSDGVTKGLAAIKKIVRTPFDRIRGQRAIRAARRLVTQEFTQGAGFGATGGRVRWRPTEAFGSRPATVPPLGGRQSSLLAAWRGGPGGFVRISGGRATFGVSLPYAAVQRGGSRAPSTRRTTIRARRRGPSGRLAMQGFLGATFGVHISEQRLRQGLRVGGRPHADARAPQYVEAGRKVLLEAVAEVAR